MTSVQKVSFSLLISLILGLVFGFFAYGGIFSVLEARFYVETMERKVGAKAQTILQAHQDWLEGIDNFLDDFSKSPLASRLFKTNLTREDIESVRTQIDAATKKFSLTGVRLVSPEYNPQYSTFPSDVFLEQNNRLQYKPGEQIPTAIPWAKLVPKTSGDKQFFLLGDTQELVWSVPIKDDLGVYLGSLIAYSSSNSLTKASREAFLDDSLSARFLSIDKVILNVPRTIQNQGDDSILKYWGKPESRLLIPGLGETVVRNFTLESLPLTAAILIPVAELQMPDFLKVLLVGIVFVTLFLTVFLLFNLRQDEVVVLGHRIKRLQVSLLQSYMENKGTMDQERWFLELQGRREEVHALIKKGLGKRAAKKSEVTALVNAGWDEILDVISARKADVAQVPQLDFKKLEGMIEKVLDNYKGQAPKAGEVFRAPATKQEAKKVAKPTAKKPLEAPRPVPVVEEPEELDELEDSLDAEPLEAVEAEELAEAEELSEAEELDEIEEVEEAEALEEAEELEDSADAEPLEAVEAEDIAEAEDLDEVEEVSEAEDLDELEDSADAESLEAVEAEDVAEAEELDEIEEVEGAEALEEAVELEDSSDAEPLEAVEAEDLAEAEDLDEVEALEDAGETEQLDEIEEVEEAEALEETEELEDSADAEPLEAVEAEDLAEAEDLDDVEALEDADEAEELDEIEEASEAEELDELEDSADADSLEAVEAEDIAEAEDLDEVEALEDADEAEELDEIEEASEPEELDELEDSSDAEPLEAVEAEELSEAEELDEIEEVEEAEALEEAEELEVSQGQLTVLADTIPQAEVDIPHPDIVIDLETGLEVPAQDLGADEEDLEELEDLDSLDDFEAQLENVEELASGEHEPWQLPVYDSDIPATEVPDLIGTAWQAEGASEAEYLAPVDPVFWKIGTPYASMPVEALMEPVRYDEFRSNAGRGVTIVSLQDLVAFNAEGWTFEADGDGVMAIPSEAYLKSNDEAWHSLEFFGQAKVEEVPIDAEQRSFYRPYVTRQEHLGLNSDGVDFESYVKSFRADEGGRIKAMYSFSKLFKAEFALLGQFKDDAFEIERRIGLQDNTMENLTYKVSMDTFNDLNEVPALAVFQDTNGFFAMFENASRETRSYRSLALVPVSYASERYYAILGYSSLLTLHDFVETYIQPLPVR